MLWAKKILTKAFAVKVLGFLLLCGLYLFLYKLLIPRINAFGCMDDCNNFIGGYFLLHGKELFAQIFFNHAPFMAHISEFVQFITRPENLHEIILRHRQFLLLFGLICEAFLIFRFGWIGLPFAIFYETTKFYLGGDRFLAEGFVVYPFVYLSGLVFEKFLKKNLFRLDYILSAICVWFIIFTREPYTLGALFLFGIIVWNKNASRVKIVSLFLFLLLSLVTVFSYNPIELFYNVAYVNKTNLAAENAQTGIFGVNIYKSFVYPFVIFFEGEWQFIRYVEIGLSALFLFFNVIYIKQRKWLFLLLVWISLGLANLRIVTPGHEYYGAFHLLPWYGMTIFLTFLFMKDEWKASKLLSIGGFIGMTSIVVFVFLSRGSYVHDKIDQQTEFITNYGQVLQVGNVVAALSTPRNTLFLDGFDDMIYFVAHKYSNYQYSWYTSLMPQYKKYTDARLAMFEKSPPDFYYGSCPHQKDPNFLLPESVKNQYERLYNLKDPSCLWVRKDIAASLQPAQWDKAKTFLYAPQPFLQNE